MFKTKDWDVYVGLVGVIGLVLTLLVIFTDFYTSNTQVSIPFLISLVLIVVSASASVFRKK